MQRNTSLYLFSAAGRPVNALLWLHDVHLAKEPFLTFSPHQNAESASNWANVHCVSPRTGKVHYAVAIFTRPVRREITARTITIIQKAISAKAHLDRRSEDGPAHDLAAKINVIT